MTEEKKKKIQANIERTNARAEGGLSGANTNRDRANQGLGNYFAGTYIPQKANAYTQGVSDFNQRYSKYLDRTQSQKQYQSPDTFTSLEQQRQSAYENPNKQYAQMYARMQLEQGNNAPYQMMYGLGEAGEKQKQSISGLSDYYSQFGSQEGYNNAMEQQRLLNYDVEDAKRKLEQLKANQPDKYGFNYDARGNQSNVRQEYADWDSKVKALEADISQAEQTKQFYEDMKDPVKRAEYESYMQEQKSLEYRYSQMNPIEKIGHQLYQGVVGAGTQYFLKPAAFVSDLAGNVVGGGLKGAGETISYNSPFAPIGQGLRDVGQSVLNYTGKQTSDWQGYFDYLDRYAEYYKNGLRKDIGNEFVADAISIAKDSIIQILPTVAVAIASGGTSLGANAMLQASSSGNAVAQYTNIATKIVQDAAKNPSFWMSFGAEGGSAYLDALNNGADTIEATIAMLATGLPNALIEIGSGIEAMPNDKSVKGIRNWLKSIGKSAHEEGMEEIGQGIISQLVGQLVNNDLHLFSVDGQTGIIDPVRMVQEYWGGAVGGSVGGVKVGYINYKVSQAQNQFDNYKVSTIKKEGSLEKMKDIVEYASNGELTALYNEIASNTAEASREECIKLYDMLMDAADGTATNIIETNLSDNYGVSKSNAAEIAPIIQSLSYDNELTIDQAEVLANNPEIIRALGTSNISAEELVAISKNSTELQDQARVLALSRSEIDNFIADQVRIDERAKQAIDMIGLKNTTSAMGIKGIAPMAIERNGVTEEISIADSSAGRVLVRTPSGETFDAEDAPFATPETQTLVQLAGDYNTDTANTFVNTYPANMDMGEYASLFADVYNLAKTSKYSLQGLYRLYAPLTSHPSVIRDAYNAAIHEIAESRRAYEEKQKSRRAKQKRTKGKLEISKEAQELVKKEHKTFADFIAKATKYTVRIIFDNEKMAQGTFDSTETEIVVNLAKGDFFSTMLHEVTHFIELNNVEGYNAFANEVMRYLSTKGILKETFERYVVSYSSEIESIDELSSEVAANAAEALMKSEDFLKELFTDKDFIQHIEGTKAQSFVEKVIAKLKEILDSIKQFMADATLNHTVAEVFAEDTEQLNRMVKLWTDAFKGAAMSEVQSIAKENTDTESSGDVKYSIEEDKSGNKYWHIESHKDIFKGLTTPEEYRDAAFSYLIGKRDKKVVVKDSMGNDIVFIRLSAEEFTHSEESSDLFNKNPEMFSKKMRLIPSLEDILINSNITWDSPDHKNHKLFKKRGFKNYRGKVGIDNVVFNSVVVVGKTDFGNVFYDINLEVDSYLPHTKSASDINEPTSSQDIIPQDAEDVKNKFSLSEPVEQTKDLIAVHNLDEVKLKSVFELGGFAMPSIAVTRADMGHGEFGKISVVFGKETIDPQASENNKVYSSDAWTPTFPTVEYKLNQKSFEHLKEVYKKLAHKFGYDEARPLYTYANESDLRDTLRREKGTEGLISLLTDDTKLMQLYLLDKTGQKVAPVTVEETNRIDDTDAELYDYLIKRLGEDVVKKVKAAEGFSIIEYRKKYFNAYGEQIMDAYGDFYAENYGFSEEQVNNLFENFPTTYSYIQLMKKVLSYLENGAETVIQKEDTEATNKKIIETARKSGYDEWIRDLFGNISEKKGIRNNKDEFTNAGNRRGFEALHYEFTLENVVKAMMEQGEKGISAFQSNIFGASAQNYSSISDIKADSGRLQQLSQEEIDEIRKEFTARFNDIVDFFYPKDNWSAKNTAREVLIEAVAKRKTKSGIASYIRKEAEGWANYSDIVVEDLIELVSDISKMPTTYFEAKPQRVVGFEEIKYAVVPDNISEDLKKKLTDNGVSVVEYEQGDESDRVSKLNSLDDVKFSLPETDSKGNKLTDQQREYFKDSKVVDSEGRLMVVYHGSPSKFTVFSHSKINSHGNAHGRGFYFTENKSLAEGYEKGDGQLLEGYLDIKKPLSEDKVTIKKSDVVKLIKAVCEKEAENLVADGGYESAKDAILDTWASNYADTYSNSMSYVYREVADILYTNDNDVEIVAEITNAVGGSEIVLTTIRDLLGYDGVIYENDYGTHEYVALASEQFKNIDNLTPTDDKDIRFSLPESDTASYEILARDNVRLQNQVKHLENEMKLTEGHKMKPEAVSKLARKLKKDYYSTLSAEEIAAELTKIFEYIADTENASGDIAMRAMHSLAKRIVDSSQKLDTTLADEYKNVTDLIRKTKIRVTPAQKDQLIYLYGSYNNFRKSNFGRMSLSLESGTPVDSLWQELSEIAPNLFETEAFPDTDMLPRISEVLDMLAPEYVNPYGQDADTFISGLASEIFDSYFDTPEVKTFADKQKAKLDKEIYKGRKRRAEQRARDKERYDERVSNLKKKQAEKIKKLKAEYKGKTEEKLLSQKAKYQDMAKRKIEKRAATVLRHKIIKKALPLADRLIHPEKNKYVPIGLQKGVAEFLSTLDLDSHKLYKGNPTRFTEKLKSLYAELKKIKETDNADMLTDTGHIESLVLGLTDVTEGKSIYDLDVADLEEVYKLVTALDTFVRQSVSVTLEGKKLELEDTSLEVIREIAKARAGGKFKKLIEFGVTGKESSLNAYRILDGLGSYDDASVFHRIAVELRNREKVMMDLYNEGSEIFRELANDKKAMDKFFGDKAEWVDIGIKDSNGNPVKITHAMLVSIYLMSLDEGNRVHISTGGLTIPTDPKAYKKGEDVYKNAVTVRLTPEQLLAIAGKMNDFDKKFAKAVQTFFDSFSKKYINETSVKILGYELAQIENYFPVISDEDFLGKNFEQMFNVTLSSYGSLKSRIKNATTPVQLMDVTSVVEKHLDFVAKYAAYAEIAQDLKRIYNYRRNLTNISVQKAIGDKLGKAGNGFFENLIDTVNDAKLKEYNWIDKLWSRATTATLAVNVSSTLKQFAAFPMAAATLGYAPLAKAAKLGLKKAPKELIRKYTGMLEYRLGSGNITAEMSSARMGKDFTKRMPMLMDWLNKMDGAIVGRLWYASEYYVDDNFKELKKGSDEYYTKVAEIFTNTVFETQANYTFMERAGIQSVRWLKPFTAFKTDAYQAFGLLYDRTARHRQAVREYKELLKNGGTEEQKKAAKAKVQATRKTMVTTYSAVILSNVTTTLAAVLATTILRKWDRVKDDEEEEVNFKGYLEYAFSELFSNLSGLITFGNQIADIISVLMNKGKWYDIEDMGLAVINDFINSFTNTVSGLLDFMSTDTSEMTDEQYQELVDKTLGKVGSLILSSSKGLGIPLGNALNIGGALKGWVGQITGNDWDEDKEKSSKAKYNSIYNAYISGDTERYEKLYDELIAEGMSDTTIKTQMKRRLYEQDSRVKEAAIASEEGRFVDYVDLVRDLVEDTGLSEGFVSDAVDYAIDKMNKKPTSNTATSDSTDAYGIMSGGVYGMNQLITATKDMNTANISKIYNSVYEEKLDYYLDEGYKKAEAEAKAKSSIKSSITSKIKPIVKELYKTNKDKFAKLRTFLMRYLDYDSKTVNNWTNE